MKPIYITAEDFQVLTQLVETRLRQNGAKVPRSLEKLQDELKRAVILDSSALPPEVVSLHSHVRLRDLETGEVESWTLTHPDHADAAKERLSILAPVGTGILGFSEGDEVDWETPGGLRRLKIEQVEHRKPIQADVLSSILG